MRPLLLLALATCSVGCCSTDPCTGATRCRGMLTGLTVGWNGVGSQCSGTFFDGRPGLISDCRGPNGRFALGTRACGPGCGAGYGGTPFVGGYGCDVGCDIGCDTGCDCGAPIGVGCAAPITPMCPSCGVPHQHDFMPGPGIVPPGVPTGHHHHSPAGTEYQSPIVPNPQTYPTSTPPGAPAASNPPVIQNTYSWRSTPRRS